LLVVKNGSKGCRIQSDRLEAGGVGIRSGLSGGGCSGMGVSLCWGGVFCPGGVASFAYLPAFCAAGRGYG
jgi:hypothetical protein